MSSKGKHHKEKEHKLSASDKIMIIMGAWRKELPVEQGNVIIAEALNYCVHHKDIKIKGYLITRRRLFLIAKKEKHSWDHILKVFSDQVTWGIYAYEKLKRGCGNDEEPDWVLPKKPFKSCPFNNPYIAKLLTGKQIHLAYYNPHIVRLEDQINNYNFCSIIDYKGGKSPVIVDK